MFKKLMQALFGRKEQEKAPTVGERLEAMQRERELRESQAPQRRPVGKHRTPPARQATASSSRTDDSLTNPLHPLNPVHQSAHYAQDYTPPTRDTCSHLSSSYDSSSSYSGSSSCDSSSSSSSSDSGSY